MTAHVDGSVDRIVDVAMRIPEDEESGQPMQVETGLTAETENYAATRHRTAANFTRNSALSVGRLFVSAAVSLALPNYLTHRLPVATYAAWVLILQLGAYVSYLDFGIQSGISKFVAEYEARGDSAGASMRASTGLALMTTTSLLGVALTLILAWQVPQLFHDMPSYLYHDVRWSVSMIGISLSFGLLCSIYPAIFFGLQQYAIPTAISLVNRILFTTCVLVSVALHQGLVVMGAMTAAVNVLTGLLQFEAWRRMARRIRLSFSHLESSVLWQMIGYCSSLAIWLAGSLCVSGLDIAIVGRYDFTQTAYYSIATLPTNFIVSMLGAAFAPLMPTTSALSIQRTPEQMGNLLARITRYSSILLILSAVPLLVAGYPILRLWVGPVYAIHTLPYLRILVLANLLRNLCLPYASMLVATNSHRVAIAGAIAEAAVNLGCSVYLALHIGAIGVAYGTLIGSFISVGMHFAVSMHFTRNTFAVSRMRLFLTGLFRPAIIAVPSLLLVPYWWTNSSPAFDMQIWILWALTTSVLTWFIGLSSEERSALPRIVSKRMNFITSHG